MPLSICEKAYKPYMSTKKYRKYLHRIDKVLPVGTQPIGAVDLNPEQHREAA
jgi:hypothetical protein